MPHGESLGSISTVWARTGVNPHVPISRLMSGSTEGGCCVNGSKDEGELLPRVMGPTSCCWRDFGKMGTAFEAFRNLSAGGFFVVDDDSDLVGLSSP